MRIDQLTNILIPTSLSTRQSIVDTGPLVLCKMRESWFCTALICTAFQGALVQHNQLSQGQRSGASLRWACRYYL